MDTSVNYLTTLNSNVFRHLFQFNPNVTHQVREVYVLSHEHSNCSRFRNQACINFHQCTEPVVDLESAELRAELSRGGEYKWTTFATLCSSKQSWLQRNKHHVKHLRFVSSVWELDLKAYNVLLQHLVVENTALESVTMVVVTTTLFDTITPEKRNLRRLMERLRRKGVSLSLEVIDYCANCTVFLDLEMCTYLTSLEVKTWPLSSDSLNKLAGEGGLNMLQLLSVGAYTLSSRLFMTLAQREHTLPPLRTLTVQVENKLRSDCVIPHLTEEDWSVLVRRFPRLQVVCDVKFIESEAVSRVLKPTAPVVEFSIWESNLERLNGHIRACHNFSRTLRMFRWHTSRIHSGKVNLDFLLSSRFYMSRQDQIGHQPITVAAW